MTLSDELPVPLAGGASRRVLLAAGVGIVVLVAGALATAGAPAPQLVRLAAAAIGFAFAFRGWHVAVGRRRRRARGWITLAIGVWLVSETSRLVSAWTGEPAILAELSVVGLAAVAAAAYVAATRGRMRPAEEAALYLDAAALFFAVTAAVVVIGSSVLNDARSVAVLAHAAFFLGILRQPCCSISPPTCRCASSAHGRSSSAWRSARPATSAC